MNLNELAQEINDVASRNGFWKGYTCSNVECKCGVERDPLAVLSLIMSEAAEAIDEIRDGNPLNVMSYNHTDHGLKPVGVPSEMADVIIRALDACAEWGIDIQKAVEEKMAYNAKRPWLHGRVR